MIPLVIVGLFALLNTTWAQDHVNPRSGGESTVASAVADDAVKQDSSAHGESSHADPIAPVLFGIIVILFAAKIGGHVFESVGQPSVLGELIIGMLLGNLSLLGFESLDFLKIDYTHHQNIDLLDSTHLAGVTVDHLARIGVILLLFQVGLESSVAQMRKVGTSAFLVAVIGVVVPAALGWGCGLWLLPNHAWPVHMFLGATLCATSVGITARVLQDLNVSRTKEAQIVLGAAVIDDVLGLVVLAFAQGVIASMSATATGSASHFGVAELGLIVGKAVSFLVVAFLLGQYIARPMFAAATFLRGKGLLIVTSLLICFGFAWLANAAGLATIVGAFAAGLILDKVHYQELRDKHDEHSLEDLLKPLIDLMVPVFFVVMGLHVDLRSFSDSSVIGLAAILSVAAILGKQACSLGVLEKGTNRVAIGLGMIPRGEVGLIFAAIGLQLRIGQERVVDESTYSALVVMVIVTTMVTPPLLKWGFKTKPHEPQPQT